MADEYIANDECMLTTIDNPFNPFDDFELWLMFDKEKGYNCCERLARIANISDDFTEKEESEEIERAIDEIIKYDFLNIYTKIRKNQTISVQTVLEDTDSTSEE